MSGYTPGPWHWVDPETDEPKAGGYASLRTVEEFGENKTEVRDGKSYTSFALPKWILDAEEVSPEDAHLIAAAPELLEALVALRATVADVLMVSGGTPQHDAMWDAARESGVAIRKATEAAS